MTTVSEYKIKIKYDNGVRTLIVISLSGLIGAINKVVDTEFCPPSAIILIKKIRESTYLNI